VKIVTLSCAGKCATVQAVATGGNPPYAYAWDDGSTNPVRQLCPTADTSYAVQATDTGESGEIYRASQTARASVAAEVLACPDGGEPDAQVPCSADAAPPSVGPWTVEVDPNGAVRDLADGGALPAGRYRAEWIDGCMRYAVGGPMFGWTVNDPPPGVYPGPIGLSTTDPGDCVLASDQAVIAALPGGTGFGTSDYPSCVAQAPMVGPVEFDFDGGVLGAVANDFGAGDNVGGESAGGVSPTFRITLLAACR
jgi:hypothetical protein